MDHEEWDLGEFISKEATKQGSTLSKTAVLSAQEKYLWRNTHKGDIGFCNISKEQVQEIYQEIRKNRLRTILEDVFMKSLVELELQGRSMDSNDAAVVAEYLKHNKTLCLLNLENNDLTKDSTKVFYSFDGRGMGYYTNMTGTSNSALSIE
jgi:hypothetical protein